MEDHESSSTGMVVGMIIGGVVVLALVVVGIFGTGLFWSSHHAEFAAVNEQVAAVGGAPQDVVVEVIPPVFGEEVMLDPKFDKAHKFLFGVWTGKLDDGGEATLQFGEGNRLEIAAKRPGDEKALGVIGRWNIVEDDGKRARLNYFTPAGVMSSHQLVWNDDGFRFQSVQTPEGGPNLGGVKLDGVVFQRRKEPAK